MPKRFPRQQYRSYHSANWLMTTSAEVKKHVMNTYRCDADPAFNALAHQAAMNGLHHSYTGICGVSFTQPTTAKRGYYSVLKYIIKNPNCTQYTLRHHFKSRLALACTLDRLRSGGLINVENVTQKQRTYSKYYATDFGKAYAKAAKQYVVQRNV